MADTMEEDDFKAFCAELKKETPDMDKIKAGMEKYGMGQLSDSQKEIFQAALFPASVKLNAGDLGEKKPVRESEKLGFQNMNGIKNALMAMQQLHKDGIIDDAQMKMFLTEPNSENGKSVMTMIALETRAVEFKAKHCQDAATKEILNKNKEVMTAIQETLGQLDYDLLKEVVNTPDASKPEPKKYVNYIKTSRGRESELNDSLRAAAERSPLEVTAEEESVKVGGTPLEVDSKVQPLKVEPKKPAEEEEKPAEDEEKVATLDDGKNDSQNGKGGFQFTPVEQQDIIDYMFKAWIIGGMNLGFEGTFKFADWLVCAATSGTETSPKASAAASTRSGTGDGGRSGGDRSGGTPSGRGAAYVSEIVNLGNRSAQSYNAIFAAGGINDREYLATVIQNIQDNIGNNPSDWKCKTVTVDGTDITPLDPRKNKDFINVLNEYYKNNPEGFKKLIENMPKTIKGLNTSFMQNIVASASHLEALETAYLREINGKRGTPIEQLKMVLPNAKMNEILETVEQIGKQKRLEILGDSSKKPTFEEQKKIAEATQKEFLDYMKNVGNAANNLRDLIGKHYEETDPTKKAAQKKQMENAWKEFEKAYNKYRDPDAEEERDPKKNDGGKKEKPMGPDEAARAEECARNTDYERGRRIEESRENIENGRREARQRKEKVKETKKRTGHNPTNTAQKPQFSHARKGASMPIHRRKKDGMGII